MTKAQDRILNLYKYGLYNTEILKVVAKARDDATDIGLILSGAFENQNNSN